MANRIVKATIKQKDGDSKVTILPHSVADIIALQQVGSPAADLKVNGTSVTTVQGALEQILKYNNGPIVKRVNGKTPMTAESSGILIGDIFLDSSDIRLSAALPYVGAVIGDSIQVALSDLDSSLSTLDSAAVKTVNGEYPENGAVTIYANEIPATNSLSAPFIIDVDGKIPLSLLPDAILGQLMYGGNIGYPTSGTTELKRVLVSTNLKSKLGLAADENYIDVINSANDNTSVTPKQYGYVSLEGVYFIATQDGYFGGTSQSPVIGNIIIGDWIISTGTAWAKVDNTDIPVTLSGDTLTVNGTSINLVTKDTVQTISNNKTFSKLLELSGGGETLTFNAISSGTTHDVGKITFFNSDLGKVDTYYLPTGTTTGSSGTHEQAPNDKTFHLATQEWTKTVALAGYIPITGATNLSGTFKPTNDLGATLGDSTHRFNQIWTSELGGLDTLQTNTVVSQDGSALTLRPSEYGTGGSSTTNPNLYIEMDTPEILLVNPSASYGISLTVPSALTSDITIGLPTLGGTLANSVNSGRNKVSKTTYITGTTSTDGTLTLGDSGISVITDTTSDDYLTATYSALKVNSKGIAIDGGQIIALCQNDADNSGNTDLNYWSVVDGGFYFLIDA